MDGGTAAGPWRERCGLGDMSAATVDSLSRRGESLVRLLAQRGCRCFAVDKARGGP